MEMRVADTLSASASLCAGGGCLALGLETQLPRDSLRSRRDSRRDNLCRRLRRGLCRRPRSVCVLAGTFLGPHKQVFEAVVLRPSFGILMRSTDMLLSVERFCVPCDGDEGRGHLVCVCLIVRGRRLPCSWAGNTASER